MLPKIVHLPLNWNRKSFADEGFLLISCFQALFEDWLENIISKLIDIPLTKGAFEDDP